MRVMREENALRCTRMKQFVYLEKVIEHTESKAITVLEPPLGGRG